jgi:hypothetical protein
MSQPNNFILPQKLVLLFLLLSSFQEISAQVVTVNDGFEGPPSQGIPPTGWENYINGNTSSGDTQPGSFNCFQEPSQGDTYLSLVTRGAGSFFTVETVVADLVLPFEKSMCYNFTIDLSLSDQLRSGGFDFVQFDYPCILEIIGCNNNCLSSADRVVLWQSDSLSNYTWKTFDVSIQIGSGSFSRLALRANHINSDFKTYSAVLVDNIQYPETPNVLFIQDDFLKLPAYASSISWYFNDVFVPNENSHSMPLLGNGRYKATYYDDNNCYRITSAEFYKNVETIDIYPNPTIDQSYVEFFSYIEGKYTFKLYDEIGKLIRTEFYDMKYGKNTAFIDLSEFAAGSYILKIERDNLETQLFRLIRTH